MSALTVPASVITTTKSANGRMSCDSSPSWLKAISALRIARAASSWPAVAAAMRICSATVAARCLGAAMRTSRTASSVIRGTRFSAVLRSRGPKSSIVKGWYSSSDTVRA
jgi:hypothetical protein